LGQPSVTAVDLSGLFLVLGGRLILALPLRGRLALCCRKKRAVANPF